jgi:hypothetical protein
MKGLGALQWATSTVGPKPTSATAVLAADIILAGAGVLAVYRVTRGATAQTRDDDLCWLPAAALLALDPNAPPVNFEARRPNGKAVQYGGGGSNGVLITGLAPLRSARRDTPVPVARGFATWGTDSGHDNKQLPHPRAFALNDESLVNMAYAAYKKTHEVGALIARTFYDQAPAKIYFYGGSEGGREALMMAQRFPTDFDGIVSVVPVANYTGGNLMRAKLAQLQREGGWINPAKVKLIQNAVNAACDKLDGLEDGVISAYEKCLSTFDLGTLRCPTQITAIMARRSLA